jgi:glycine/D-amino acid oxidase-like deaminating enzyme
MEFDHFIIGQGIAGTLLSRELLRAGKTVLVIDKARADSSSKVAAGIINPVTGKRYVAQNSDHLTAACKTFKELSDELGCDLIRPCDVIRFDPLFGRNIEELARSDQFSVNYESQDRWADSFQYSETPKRILAARIVDLHSLLWQWRSKLEDKGYLLDEKFSREHFSHDEELVHYKGHSARSLICCEGSEVVHNPFFKAEAMVMNKGQALILSIPGLPADNIYMSGIKLVPWHDGLFWAGTSFELVFDDTSPTAGFVAMMKGKLAAWLKLPYTIEDHIASVRMTNQERTPVVKAHAQFPNIMIFNGLGSKGCLTAPYYAKELARKLMR